MKHRASWEDQIFRRQFEACAVRPAAFDHRAHVRLAYIYLCASDVDTAYQALRHALQQFLDHHGVDPATYHETMTRAWVLAVRHFMMRSSPMPSAASFIEQNPRLLDTRIMLTHYTKATLFSDEARSAFIEPDLDPIPEYGS